MLKRLLGKTPIEVWVIKQIDSDLLHLCGRATLPAKPSRKAVLEQLPAGCYQGPVTMATGGLVLNAQLFARLIPVDELEWLADDRLRWQHRDWQVAQVPQRCWTYRDRLTLQSSPDGRTLISAEDVSRILRRAEQEPPRIPGQVVFRSGNTDDHPLVAPLETHDDRLRPKPGREWRRDDD